MSDVTAHLALPLIAAGQAQKEVFHNEALALIDAAVQPCAIGIGRDDPPDAPGAGECWIVGDAPSAAWAGHAGALAAWTEGGWRFVAPFDGMTVWLTSDGLPARHDGQAWRVGEIAAARLVIGGAQVVGARQPAIAPPAGGATVDVEARAAIAALIVALWSHGLIDR